MSKEGTCLKDCISFLFNIDNDEVPNFIIRDDWFNYFVKYINNLGYIVHYSEEIKEEQLIDSDYYLVWGMSKNNIEHSVIHYKGHLYYDSFKMEDKDEPYIIDFYHKNCDKWIFGVKNVYAYVWFEKKNK